MEIIIQPIRGFLQELDIIREEESVSAVILCTSYKDSVDLSLLSFMPYCFLEFDDTVEEKKKTAFNNRLAAKVHAFVNSVNDIDVLYVCCDCGQSRSPAIAAAITLFMGKSDQSIWQTAEYCPNVLIFLIQLREFGLFLSERQLQMRIECNKNAFYKA